MSGPQISQIHQTEEYKGGPRGTFSQESKSEAQKS